MKIVKELIKPEVSRSPFYETVVNESKTSFNCCICAQTLFIDPNIQIDYHWVTKSPNITKDELMFLFDYYKIGMYKKSLSGGIVIFDKLICKHCNSHYITFCSVKEQSNSVYTFYLEALLYVDAS
jgi:transcription elongation factor Elf1